MGAINTVQHDKVGDFTSSYGCEHASKSTQIKSIIWKEVDLRNYSCNIPGLMSGTSQLHFVQDSNPGQDCIEVRSSLFLIIPIFVSHYIVLFLNFRHR